MAGYVDLAPYGKPSFPGVLLTDDEVAYRLNVARNWLDDNRNIELLDRMGFPQPVAVTGERWDAEAVWTWQRAMAAMNRRLPAPPAAGIGERLDPSAWLDSADPDTDPS